MSTFRGLPACECQITWIPVYEAHLQWRGIIDGPLPIAQLIGGNPSSGGTHVSGGVSDFWLRGGTADRAVWVARQMGADATWHRPFGWDGRTGAEHIHSVLRGCPHNSPARYQIAAVDAGFNGLGHLGMGGRDTGPRPLTGRTWQQGIAWAREQEDEMSSPKDWDAEDWAAFAKHVAPAVWEYIVREASEVATEQSAQAALKKAANR